MIVVHKIDIGTYDPISYGSNYLYNQFDRIQSFLNNLGAGRFKNLLAKPVISNSQVLWYANFSKSFSRLSEFGEQTQVEIKSKYWEVRQILNEEIEKLSVSRDAEKQNWAGLLKEVFNEDDNVILTDGSDWCLLWGWKFRNTKENYLDPEFMPKITTTATPTLETTLIDQLQPAETPPVSVEPEITPLVTAPITPVLRSGASFWDRIKRFLRTFVYRFWGLLLLIMFILFLSCLFKYCSNKRARQSCLEMNELNKKMIELDKKVQDRCNQIKK